MKERFLTVFIEKINKDLFIVNSVNYNFKNIFNYNSKNIHEFKYFNNAFFFKHCKTIKCDNCKYCKFVDNINEINFKNVFKPPIVSNSNFTSSNFIYILYCIKFNAYYIGETSLIKKKDLHILH